MEGAVSDQRPKNSIYPMALTTTAALLVCAGFLASDMDAPKWVGHALMAGACLLLVLSTRVGSGSR